MILLFYFILGDIDSKVCFMMVMMVVSMGYLSVCVVYNGSEGGELPALGVGYRGGEFRHRLRYFLCD